MHNTYNSEVLCVPNSLKYVLPKCLSNCDISFQYLKPEFHNRDLHIQYPVWHIASNLLQSFHCGRVQIDLHSGNKAASNQDIDIKLSVPFDFIRIGSIFIGQRLWWWILMTL